MDELAIQYVIGGSIASIFHGLSRSTLNADIVAELDSTHIEKFIPALKDAFYVDELTVRQAVENQGGFNFIHLETMFKVQQAALDLDYLKKWAENLGVPDLMARAFEEIEGTGESQVS